MAPEVMAAMGAEVDPEAKEASPLVGVAQRAAPEAPEAADCLMPSPQS